MGTLKDKLIYIKETLSILKPNGTLDWVARMSGNSNMTLRERMNFVKSICDMQRSVSMSPHLNRESLEKVTVTLADGSTAELNPDMDHYVIFPPYKLHTSVILQLPICKRNAGNTYIKHIDLSQIKSSNSCQITLVTFNHNLRSLILNDHQVLAGDTIHGHSGSWFEEGLRFGKNVYNCSSKWINGVATNGPKNLFVSVPEGFEGTVYLSMLNISAECLVGIINNLADMSETTTVYTLGLGSTNIAKLTEEQLAIAEAKGWIVT